MCFNAIPLPPLDWVLSLSLPRPIQTASPDPLLELQILETSSENPRTKSGGVCPLAQFDGPSAYLRNVPLRTSTRVASPDYDPVLRFVRSTVLSVTSPAAIFQTATLLGFTSQSFSLPMNRLAVLRRLPLLPLPDFLSTDSRTRASCVTATRYAPAVPRRFSVYPSSWPFPALQPGTSSNLGSAPEGSSHGKSFTGPDGMFHPSHPVRALSGFRFSRLFPLPDRSSVSRIHAFLRLSVPPYPAIVGKQHPKSVRKLHPFQGFDPRSERVSRSRSLPP